MVSVLDHPRTACRPAGDSRGLSHGMAGSGNTDDSLDCNEEFQDVLDQGCQRSLLTKQAMQLRARLESSRTQLLVPKRIQGSLTDIGRMGDPMRRDLSIVAMANGQSFNFFGCCGSAMVPCYFAEARGR